METLSTEEFSAAIKKYAKENNLTTAALADLIGRPRATVDDWRYKGIKRASVRERIMRELPQIFSDQSNTEISEPAKTLMAEEAVLAVIQTATKKVATKSISPKDIQVLMKIELGRHGIVVLSDILQWFIDKSPEERNRFREELDSLWKNFLELTRAMTGENARKIALQEGRIRSVNHD